jgi:hypothetical protein
MSAKKTTTVTSTKQKVNLELDLEDMRTGFANSVPPGVTTIFVSGKPTTPSQVVSQLDALLPPFTEATQAKADYDKALLAKAAVKPAAKALLGDLRAAVRAMFPGDAASQARFGVIAKPRAKSTPLTKAAAAVKQAATRAKNKPPAVPPVATVVLNGPDGNPIVPSASTAPVSPGVAVSAGAVGGSAK